MKDSFGDVVSKTTSDFAAQNDINLLVTLERIGAILSLLGVSLIFVTYWAFKRMRSLHNLFVLLASIANVGASIACAIGYGGLHIGADSGLCQTQAFLLQVFMQSDPWWSFAMAVNAFLIFFDGANPSSFRRYLWVYCAICFGGPLILGICLLVIKPDGAGASIYGDAALWCWITTKWGVLRIYTFYVPTWCCIFGSAVVYFIVGYHVFHQRDQLRNLILSNPSNDSRNASWLGKDYSAAKESHSSWTPMSEDWSLPDTQQSLTGRTENCGDTAIDIQATTVSPKPWVPQMPCSAMTNDFVNPTARDQDPKHLSDEQAALQGSPLLKTTYYSSPPSLEPQLSILPRVGSVNEKISSRLKSFDPIKLAYLRTCCLFAVSVLFTWTPSSINIIYELVNPNNVSFGLNVACAVVLPLQGVWNAVIFFMTSCSTFREEWTEMRHFRQTRHLDSHGDQPRRARFGMFRGAQEHRLSWGGYRFNKRFNRSQTRDFETATSSLGGDIRVMQGFLV
ncbi:g-protein coupled receptor [Colletotrichum truncatum]|uniref:G-protein coupled receptor n=1 Tax=Colletotrichum truncatum TaxID=5467 RepID=A0ACC3ZBJ5_COLTU|nr:g-protein coupled receptor [Colletotrichum truncatum]KAF6787774.1 g-protein coupled receptor [Colletotrichum truncatum]